MQPEIGQPVAPNVSVDGRYVDADFWLYTSCAVNDPGRYRVVTAMHPTDTHRQPQFNSVVSILLPRAPVPSWPIEQPNAFVYTEAVASTSLEGTGEEIAKFTLSHPRDRFQLIALPAEDQKSKHRGGPDAETRKEILEFRRSLRGKMGALPLEATSTEGLYD